MSKAASLREMRPYHLLFLAVLCAVALAQIAAMVIVTQQQVLKAKVHYASAPTAPVSGAAKAAVEPQPERTVQTDAVKVGYLLPR